MHIVAQEILADSFARDIPISGNDLILAEALAVLGCTYIRLISKVNPDKKVYAMIGADYHCTVKGMKMTWSMVTDSLNGHLFGTERFCLTYGDLIFHNKNTCKSIRLHDQRFIDIDPKDDAEERLIRLSIRLDGIFASDRNAYFKRFKNIS